LPISSTLRSAYGVVAARADRAEEALVVGLELVRDDLDEEREHLDALAQVREVVLVERRERVGHADVHRRHHDALEDVDRDRRGRTAQRDDLRDRLEQATVTGLLCNRLVPACGDRRHPARRPARSRTEPGAASLIASISFATVLVPQLASRAKSIDIHWPSGMVWSRM
jgi:hypothetical protein